MCVGVQRASMSLPQWLLCVRHLLFRVIHTLFLLNVTEKDLSASSGLPWLPPCTCSVCPYLPTLQTLEMSSSAGGFRHSLLPFNGDGASTTSLIRVRKTHNEAFQLQLAISPWSGRRLFPPFPCAVRRWFHLAPSSFRAIIIIIIMNLLHMSSHAFFFFVFMQLMRIWTKICFWI